MSDATAEPADVEPLLTALASNRVTFASLLRGLDADEYRWHLHEQHWSLLEIICHLCDEERDDFRARLNSILTDPTQPLPRSDPQAWVSERRYSEQDFEERIDTFVAERNRSLAWLRSLRAPRWENTFQHPTAGPLSAYRMLVNWVAHDYLHIRQIAKVQFHYLHWRTGESLDYAGTWQP